MARIFGKTKKSDEQTTEVQPKVAAEQKTQSTETTVKAEKKENKPATAVKGKSTNAYRVLVKPLVTEKAAHLGASGQYAFMVDADTNKIEIKKAIRAVYNVEPVAVNIVTMMGKNVRYGRSFGRRKNWKKAIVTLKPGDKIEIYEGV